MTIDIYSSIIIIIRTSDGHIKGNNDLNNYYLNSSPEQYLQTFPIIIFSNM
ncbi:MAG: hypothetical protein M5F18_06725 [Asgard group archaeon]|nr:hypothetical protein [Asgard group archaeon]